MLFDQVPVRDLEIRDLQVRELEIRDFNEFNFPMMDFSKQGEVKRQDSIPNFDQRQSQSPGSYQPLSTSTNLNLGFGENGSTTSLKDLISQFSPGPLTVSPQQSFSFSPQNSPPSVQPIRRNSSASFGNVSPVPNNWVNATNGSYGTSPVCSPPASQSVEDNSYLNLMEVKTEPLLSFAVSKLLNSESNQNYYAPSFSPPQTQVKNEVQPVTTKPKRKTRLCSLTAEEKGERRKQQNRLAASRCRKKKQAALQELQHCTDDVQRENDSLKLEIAQLRKLVAELQSQKAC